MSVAARLEEPHVTQPHRGESPGAPLMPDELADDAPTDLPADPAGPPVLSSPAEDDEGLATEGGLFGGAMAPDGWAPPAELEDSAWRPDGELAASLTGEAATAGPGWHLSPEPGDAAPALELPVDAVRPGLGGSGDLEALLLETENLRLRRELHEDRRLRAEVEAQLHEQRARHAAAEAEVRDWRAAAAAAEARLQQLEWKLAHYQAFAESGWWTRLGGCPPFSPPALIKDS